MTSNVWGRINRSAVIMAVLLGIVKLGTWTIDTYVPDAELAAILKTVVYDIGIALGVVSNSRPQAKPKVGGVHA